MVSVNLDVKILVNDKSEQWNLLLNQFFNLQLGVFCRTFPQNLVCVATQNLG